MGDSRREYQQLYYQDNKERLSEKRKSKYRNDPEYRERVKEASRKYREKKRANRPRKKVKKPVKTGRQSREPVTVKINGVNVLAYTVSTLAERVGRSINTINHWISIGTIPRTPLWSERGDRLYTDAMILIVKVVVQQRGIVGRDPLVREEIIRGWKDIGVKVKNRAIKARRR